jgi:5-methylcytosine-specific restriction enzyme B
MSENENIRYFIFGNKPMGEYETSIWDTSTILITKEYYFRSKVNLTDRVQPGDKVIFKEFDSQIYWGEATIDSKAIRIATEAEEVFKVLIKDVKKWLYPLDTNTVYSQLSNKDTRARIVSITKHDYQIILQEMENSSALSTERQNQLRELWDGYKSEKIPPQQAFDKNTEDWQKYKTKIINGSFGLDDYTNTISNLKLKGEEMPGYYLCNYLERTTKSILGSSKPGNAFRFGVKMNNDCASYTIRQKDNHKIESKTDASREEAEKIFNEDIKKLITEIITASDIEQKIDIVENNSSVMGAKQLLRKIIVLDHQLEFLYIYSEHVINSLYEEFVNANETRILAKNRDILTLMIDLFDLDPLDHQKISRLSGFLWDYYNARGIADVNTPNVILYGPPGTGKTYNIKKSLEFVCRGNKGYYEYVQFHPSYTYEDFIEGVRPKGVTTDGNIKFEMVNGVFKQFCIKAKNDPDNNYYFVIDEINRANLSSVFGETLLCLEKDYRHDVKSGKTDNLIKTQYATLIQNLDSEQQKGLSYHKEANGEVYFGVPSNLFFIGMMNDVDKSIDAFDLALRRRFKWIRKDCDYEVISDQIKFRNGDEFLNINEYVKACRDLNEYISETLGLGKSYEFGHSFFMKISEIARQKKISQGNAKELFYLHLSPTLKEYLRAAYAEKELDDKLNSALAKFIEELKQ